jgi:integrase
MARTRRSPGEGGIYPYDTAKGRKWFFKATLLVGTERKPVVRRGFNTRAEAARALREALSQSEAGEFVGRTDVTIREWFEHWVANLTAPHGTVTTYKRSLDNVILPKLGHHKLTSITTARLTAFYRELEIVGGGKRGKPLATRSIHLAAAVVSAALRAAVEAEPPLLARNPATKAKVSRLDGDSAATKAWTPGQLHAFLAYVDEHAPEHSVLWRLGAATGMRRGELLALEWRDLNGDTLIVRRNLTFPEGEPVLGPTKTRRVRSVALDAETMALLKTWRATRGNSPLAAPLFTNENGRHHRPHTVSSWFARDLERCRADLGPDVVPRITLHGLRHTHCTLMLAAGVSPKVVAERTGHSVNMLMTTYAHALPGAGHAATEQVAALMRQAAQVAHEAVAERPHLRVVKGA